MDILKMFSLSGKVAIITGGTGVLGSEMAKALAKAGASVAVLGRRLNKAQEICDQIIADGGSALPIAADVLDKDSLKTAKQLIVDQWGTIDILINAAGGNMPGAVVQPTQSFVDIDEENLQQVINLNQLGTILPCKVFMSSMIDSRSGVVVNISSMAAQSAITRVVGYSAAKAGIDNFTKWLAVEMAQKYGDKIRVNAIAPGFFISEQNRTLLTNADGSLTERGNKIIANTPMNRFGEPEELVGTLLYLCSDASAFVTGTIFEVDGGFNAYSGV